MDEKTRQIARIASLLIFTTVWLLLIRAGAFSDGITWFHAGYFIMGVAFGVGILSQARVAT